MFETDDLFFAGPDIAVLVPDYLFRVVENSLDGRPTLLVIDDTWASLEHPLFANHIRSWLKELRKAHASVVLATQSVADATSNEITSVFVENCPTKTCLPNAAAKTRASRDQ